MRKESFPVLFGFLLEGMKVFTRCPCYLLTAGLLHVIALQCSLMERENGLKSRLPPLNRAWLLLELCCRCCESEPAWRREAVSAHQHGWVQIFVVYCQPANLMAFRESQAFSQHTQAGGCAFCFAEIILQSELK